MPRTLHKSKGAKTLLYGGQTQICSTVCRLKTRVEKKIRKIQEKAFAHYQKKVRKI